jgi:NADH-quinone oxidoreductase subunit J
MNFTEFLFWFVGLATTLSAVMVAVSQNIVRAAVWLLFTLAGTAGLYFLLGADFIGAVQLIVYVGGILILVIFGVMLTAQGPFVQIKTAAGEWVIALVVGMTLLGTVGACIFTGNWGSMTEARVDDETANAPSVNRLGTALLGVPAPPQPLNVQPVSVQPVSRGGAPPAPGAHPAASHPGALQMKQPVAFLFPFEIVSIHLVVVLIGAAYLARAKRRQTAFRRATGPTATGPTATGPTATGPTATGRRAGP